MNNRSKVKVRVRVTVTVRRSSGRRELCTLSSALPLVLVASVGRLSVDFVELNLIYSSDHVARESFTKVDRDLDDTVFVILQAVYKSHVIPWR